MAYTSKIREQLEAKALAKVEKQMAEKQAQAKPKPISPALREHLETRSFTNSLYSLTAGLTEAKSKLQSAEWANEILQPLQLYNLYWRSRPGKAIDAPVEDALAKWRVFEADADLKKVIEDAETRYGLRDVVELATKEAELYGGAAILMRINDGGGTLDAPLDIERVRAESLLGFQVLNRTQLTADMDSLDTDPMSPRFEQPVLWKKGEIKIHYSRLAFIQGIEGPRLPNATLNADSFWGQSRLQRIHDYAKGSEMFSTCIGELAAEAKIDLFKIPGFAQMLSTPSGTQALLDRFLLVNTGKSVNNAVLMDAEEDWQQKQIAFSGLVDILKTFWLMECAVADMPATRYLGQAASGLNATGEGDADNYLQRLESLRNRKIGKLLHDIDQVFIRSVLGSYPEDLTWSWPPIEKMNELEEAQIAKLEAETAVQYLNAGVITENIVAEQLLAERVYNGLTQEFVDALATMIETEPSQDTDEEPQ